jgi:hypothetical protein
MAFMNALATSIGWILIFGSTFWGLCVLASYARQFVLNHRNHS